MFFFVHSFLFLKRGSTQTFWRERVLSTGEKKVKSQCKMRPIKVSKETYYSDNRAMTAVRDGICAVHIQPPTYC
jgi:hypothetical protein